MTYLFWDPMKDLNLIDVPLQGGAFANMNARAADLWLAATILAVFDIRPRQIWNVRTFLAHQLTRTGAHRLISGLMNDVSLDPR